MEAVKPTNYEITFEPDLKKCKFHGMEKILLDVKKPTNKLILNSLDLKIKNCGLTCKGSTLKPKVSLDKKKEELVLKFSEKFSGKSELFIGFDGLLKDNLVGFYRSKYHANGKEKYLATTQFEAADARRAFPCWDNPEYKATFNVSVIIDKKLVAISNMPIIKEKKIDSRKKIVNFGQTPPMSTYLVYLGVGEFEFIKDKLGKILIRVATTPGKKNQGKLALEFAKKFVKFYQDYFQIKYPLPKLDLIAMPDFAAGAMENWGAITFRETGLLYNSKTSSTGTKQYIAEVISHELVHQWFGDLVTMKWWDDLWLNESFATFVATKAIEHYYPEWEFQSQFLQSDTASALKMDALKTSHPIHVDVKTPAEIAEIFDDISYQKGGSVLKMLENYLGEKVFQKGLKHYLATYKYGNATTEDLWSSLEKASKKPVKKMMDGWIKQIGYPMVEADVKNSDVILTQRRFLFEQAKSKDASKWLIPLSIKLEQKNISQLIKEKTGKIKIGSYEWFKINAGQNGFYIVKYPKQILEKFRGLIGNKLLPNADRWGIQNDLFAFAVSGEIPLNEYLSFVKSYNNEDDYLVSTSIEENLSFICLVTSKENFSLRYKNYSRKFLRRVFDRLGWQPKPGERHTDALLRAQTIIHLGRIDEKDILNATREKFQKFLKNPNSLNPDLRSAVYNLAAWDGDETTYKTLMKLYHKAPTHEEKRRFLYALGGFKNPELLNKTLQFSLSPNVRSQDMLTPIASVSYNPYGRDIVWPWIKKNWNKIKARVGETKFMFSRIIDTMDGLADIAAADDIKKFFEKNPEPKIKMSVAQTLEEIRVNAKLLERIREFSTAK